MARRRAGVGGAGGRGAEMEGTGRRARGQRRQRSGSGGDGPPPSERVRPRRGFNCGPRSAPGGRCPQRIGLDPRPQAEPPTARRTGPGHP